jgi:hypothetical protein
MFFPVLFLSRLQFPVIAAMHAGRLLLKNEKRSIRARCSRK